MSRDSRIRWLGAVFAPAILLLTAGCGDKAVSPDSGLTDQAEIDQIIGSEEAEIFGAPFFTQEEGEIFAGSGEMGGIDLAPGDDQRWRRFIDSRVVTITHESLEDGVILATWEAVYAGKLYIIELNTENGTRVVTEKDIEGTFRRQARFVRHERNEETRMLWPQRRWHLDAVSLGLAESRPVLTVGIESITMTNLDSGFSRTYDDPLALLDVQTEIPYFQPGEHVVVEVTVTDPSVFVYMHHNRHRVPMRSAEEGVFTSEFIVPDLRMRHQVVFDVLDDATLLDPEGPYDSIAWGIIYGVRR